MATARGKTDPAELIRSLVGGYSLEHVLGTGEVGAVYAAVGPAGERCALKVIRGDVAGADGRTRLMREAQLASDIKSPHIVEVISAGHDAERDLAFLVMPILEGESVAGLLGKVSPLSPQAAVRIALQACEGLSAAHRAGVIHRDIKPSNLFLSIRPDGDRVVVVCDFGIAKRFELYDDTQLTWTGRFLGSPAYMSPEQAKSSKHVDERTDIWSLGVTLYELLCGKVPCANVTSVAELLVEVCTRNVPPIQDRAPWIEPGLAVAVHRALRRNRDERWPSIAAFAASLEPFAGGDQRLGPGEPWAMEPEVKRRIAPRAEFTIAASGATDRDGPVGARDELAHGLSLAGRYTILRAIGKGGMGAVYEAEGPEGERVAVKVIPRDLAGHSDVSLRRFLREAGTAMAIDDPHVVKVFATGSDEALGVPFIVMELLDGIDCAMLFKRSAPIDVEPLIRLFIQAGRGIAAAHRKGIVHRDIKPANLFLHVARETGQVTVKVCDFGIAKATTSESQDQGESTLTATGRLIGSPLYMSPEQARNAKHVDHRTDVWAFAISLYEGLTGKRAWHGYTSLGEIILAICTENPPPIQDLAPWIGADLAEIIHRGLARDPAQRWSTIEEMMAALEPHAGKALALDRDDLRTVKDERRSIAAPRASASSHAETPKSAEGNSTPGTGLASVTTGSQSPTGRRFAVIGGGLLLAVGAAVLIGARHPPSPTTLVIPAGEPLAPAPREVELAAKTVWVAVGPAGSEVRVDGQSVAITDGRVQLTGRPGDRFELQISYAGARKSATVVIAGTGEAIPASLTVEPPPTASAAAGSAAASAAVRKRPDAGEKTALPSGPFPSGTAATSAAPPAAPKPAPSKVEDPLGPGTWK
jgi:serine/threonine protein kinase